MAWGPSRCEELHSGNTGGAGVGVGGMGKGRSQLGRGRRRQIKSQPLPRQPWERLSKASPWPRPPKAPPAPWSSASGSDGAALVNKRLIIQETLEQDDEIFLLLLRSPRAFGQTSQA